MSEWKKCRLGEVITLKRGFDLPSQDRANGKVPVYSSSGITAFHTVAKANGPGVITGRYGTIGEVFFSPVDFWPLNTSLFVEDFKGNDPRFVYYLLTNFDFESFNDKSAVPGINRNHVHTAMVLLPSITEQRAIASVLSSLDDKIDLLRRQNKTLEAICDAVYTRFFIDGRKDEWQELLISDLAKHEKMTVLPNRNPQTLYHHYSIPAFDQLRAPIPELGLSIQSNKYKVRANTILFSKLNPHRDKRLWLVLDPVGLNAVCSTEFQVMNPRAQKHLFYLYGFVRYSENYDEIAAGVGGTSGSHQRIDPNVIFSFKCFSPNDKTLAEFDAVVEPMYRKMQHNLNAIQTLKSVRDTLLPRLMSGEVRVKL